MTSVTSIGSAGHSVSSWQDGDPAIEEALLSSSFYQDPYPVYARLRAEAPVYWSPSSRMWLVTSGDLVAEVTSNWEVFSRSAWDQFFLNRLPAELLAELPTLVEHYRAPRIITTDPPAHTRLRRLLSKAFTPRRMAKLEGRVRAITAGLLDALGRRGGARGEAGVVEFDMVADVAVPLPIAVIGALFGIENHTNLQRWSRAAVTFSGSAVVKADVAREFERALAEFRVHILELVAERRRQSRDDLLSDLVAAVDEGDRLSEEELVSMSTTLLVAGHETTANFLGNAMLALLRHPDQLVLLRRCPELLPGAVEELLRYDTPVQRGVRTLTTRDVALGNQEIPAGMPVTGFLGAANRDPDLFDRPDELDVTRPDVVPMSFGGRPHHCVGAALARLEGRVAIGMLLDRFDELRLAENFEERWLTTVAFRGLHELALAGRRADP